MSDQDSLRSPLSANSSVGGSRDGINSFDYDTMSSSPAPTDGEADYIDVDLPSPSHDNNKGMLSLPPPRVASTTTKENYKRKVRKKESEILLCPLVLLRVSCVLSPLSPSSCTTRYLPLFLALL